MTSHVGQLPPIHDAGDLRTLKENDEYSLSYQEALAAVQARNDLRSKFLYLPFPLAFFLLFAGAALTHIPISHMYPAQHGLISTLVSSGTDAITSSTTTKFMNIQTQADVFSWLTDTLIPSVFVTTDYNGNTLSRDSIRRIATFHRILGAVEFKTYKAIEYDCGLTGPLGKIYQKCHDFENPTNSIPFYIDAGANSTTATIEIQQRQTNGTWLDSSTSQLDINFATYDGELDLLVVTTLTIYFQPGGYIETKYKMDSIPADPYHFKGPLALDILIGILFLGAIGLEFKSAYLHYKGKKKYWGIWCTIEWSTILSVLVFYILWIVLCCQIYNTDLSNQILSLEVTNTFDFSKPQDLSKGMLFLTQIMDHIRSMAKMMVAVRLTAMTTLLLLMIRILGSVRFHPRLNIVTATLGKALNALGPFFFIFLVCLAAFVTSGCLLFGEKLEQFSTIGYSLVTVVNMLFGQFEMNAIFDIDYHIALIWYWLSMIVLFLVLFNMLLAIVIAAFDEVRQEKNGPARSIGKEFSIIAKEMFGVEHFLHHDAPKKFRQSIRDGSIGTQRRFDCKALSERLHINENEAKGLISNFKVLSAAGQEVKRDGPTDNDVKREGPTDNEVKLDAMQEKVEKLEHTIQLLIQQLQVPEKAKTT